MCATHAAVVLCCCAFATVVRHFATAAAMRMLLLLCSFYWFAGATLFARASAAVHFATSDVHRFVTAAAVHLLSCCCPGIYLWRGVTNLRSAVGGGLVSRKTYVDDTTSARCASSIILISSQHSLPGTAVLVACFLRAVCRSLSLFCLSRPTPYHAEMRTTQIIDPYIQPPMLLDLKRTAIIVQVWYQRPFDLAARVLLCACSDKVMIVTSTSP